MIVDVHSHVWEYPRHFGDGFRLQAIRARAGVEVDLTVRYEQYRATCPPDTGPSSSAARRGSATSGSTTSMSPTMSPGTRTR